MLMHRHILSLSAVGALLSMAAACSAVPPPSAPASASAPAPASVEFRVVPTDRNPSSCRRWDADLSRVHTFTRTGDTATLQTAGGISSMMTMSAPNVFTTTMALGGTNFDVIANVSAQPRSLDVSEPRTGCRWSAIAR